MVTSCSRTPGTVGKCSFLVSWRVLPLCTWATLKLASLCYVLAIVLVKWRHNPFDIDRVKCQGLFVGHTSPLNSGQQQYQQTGCMPNSFSPLDSRQCLHSKSALFLGDSRLRDVYAALTSYIIAPDVDSSQLTFQRHANRSFADPAASLDLTFIWSAFVSDAWVHTIQHFLKAEGGKPNFIVLHSGLWQMRADPGKAAFQKHINHVTSVVRKLSEIVMRTPTVLVWLQLGHVKEEVLSAGRKNITNANVVLYNRAVAKIWSKYQNRRMFLLEVGYAHLGADGLHFDVAENQKISQILLNVICPSPNSPSQDDKCCHVGTFHPTSGQMFLFVSFVSCVAIYVTWIFLNFVLRKLTTSQLTGVLPLKQYKDPGMGVTKPLGLTRKNTLFTFDGLFMKNDRHAEHHLVVDFCRTVCTLCLVMFYFYAVDRTTLFAKESKSFSWTSFSIPLALFAVVGVLTNTKAKEPGFLNRQQTQETRGWMQLFLLVYHYTGASKILGIYFVARLVVAMYLFLSAYGHFTYCIKHGASKWQRIVEILLRLNIFAVLLCVTMDVPYQHYYFVPLISVTYLVVLAIAALPPAVWSKQRTCGLQLLKILFVASLLAWYRFKPETFNGLVAWYPMRKIFLDDRGTFHEWSFRFGLDAMAIPSGILMALLMETPSIAALRSVPNRLGFFLTMLAGCSLAVYVVAMATECSSKPTCNLIHTFVSPVIMFAFVVMRNVWTSMRQVYSSFFEVTGRYSLELFIAQYHVLLADDTHSLLILVTGNETVNVIVVAAIFVAVSHTVAECTQALVGTFKLLCAARKESPATHIGTAHV